MARLSFISPDYMRKVVEAEKSPLSDLAFDSDGHYAPLEAVANSAVSKQNADIGTAVLDKFVELVKFVFLYIPGAAAIHLIMLGFALARFYGAWSPEMLVGTAGVALVSAFMIVLGIGKLSQLKYLRVVGTVSAASAIWAIVYSILIIFLPGDYFGLFAQLTLPLTLLAGYLVKRETEKSEIDPAS